jgi:hypothetical protein
MTRLLRRLVTPAALAMGLVFVLLLPPSAPAQQRKPNPFAEGTHVLRRILFDLGCDSLERFDQLDDPAHTILIVLGDMSRLDEVPGGLKAFVGRGGAALLATDQKVDKPEAEKAISEVAGVQINGRQVVILNEDPRFRYKGLPDCPIVWPSATALGEVLFRNPRGKALGPLSVATNIPSYLSTAGSRPRGVVDFARFPRDCARESTPGNLVPFANWLLPPLFGVGGDVGDGRVLVMADHSVFINEMLMQTDNDNFEFAYNCLEWLQGEGKQRTKVLFVEEGRVQTNFNIPLKQVLPPWDVLERQFVAGLNEGIADFQKHDGFNQMFYEGAYDLLHLTPRDVGRVLALLVALGLLVYGSYRIGVRGRFRPEPNLAPLDRALENQTPAGSLLEERRQAMFRAGNLWETARELAQQFFTAAEVTPGDRPPRVETEGGRWQRRHVRRLVRRLWQLARGTHPVAISPRTLRRLLPEIDELKVGLADGSVRFLS